MTHRVYQKSIIIFAAIVVGLFAFAPTVFAFAAPPSDPNLEVIFDPNPLFEQMNFAPGETTTGQIEVKNNTPQTQKVQIEAINQTNTGSLAEQLDFVVKQGENPLYTKTLKQFFDAGEVYLSDLASGATVKYDVSITFKSEAGNGLQGKNTGFDLSIGFQGTEDQDHDGDDQVTVFGSVSTGGGGTASCSISESGITVADITSAGAVITWSTSQFTDSRVVYAAEGESFSFSPSLPPNFGYPHFVYNSAQVTGHKITLTGLAADTRYLFRVVSCAPSSVSFEHQFTTLPGGTVAGGQTGPGGEVPLSPATGGQTGGTAGTPTGAGQVAGVSETAGTVVEPGEVKGEVTQAQSGNAAVQSATGCQPLPWWPLGYLAYACFMLLAVFLGRDGAVLYRWLSLSLLLAAALVWWWITPCGLHPWYWPVIALVIFLAAVWHLLASSPDNKSPGNQRLPLP